MAGNPFDLNRDGRWSTPERALTHYGVDPLVRGGAERGGCGGCGCALVLLALLALVLIALVM